MFGLDVMKLLSSHSPIWSPLIRSPPSLPPSVSITPLPLGITCKPEGSRAHPIVPVTGTEVNWARHQDQPPHHATSSWPVRLRTTREARNHTSEPCGPPSSSPHRAVHPSNPKDPICLQGWKGRALEAVLHFYMAMFHVYDN